MIQDYLTLAIRNLKRKKLRSSLTTLGIFISITTIFVLISLSLGLNEAVKEQFRLLGGDKVFIGPKGQAGPPGAGGAVELTTKDAEIVKKINGVKDITYYAAGNAKIEFNSQIRYSMIIAMPPEASEVYKEMNFKADEGRFFRKGEKNKIVIGYNFKYKNIFKRAVRKGDSIKINEKEFEVVGIMQQIGNPQDDSQITIAYEDFNELFNSKDRVDGIMVQIKQGEDIKKISERINKELKDFRNVDENTRDFDIQTPEELLRSFGTILNLITVFLLGIAGISILVGSIGIANTMYTSVLERTKDIGIMKAIGAKNSDILSIFVIESGLLGLIGGALGILTGIGIGKLMEYIASNQLGTNLLKVIFPWYLIIGCLLFAFVIGSLSGLFPAMQASKIKPADTLRYE